MNAPARIAAPRMSGALFSKELTASIVVFLVAMPLCMGIAIASGVPAEKGLITGIIGGIVVGLLAGSPLQVSGPAAGLAVIVYEIVTKQGLGALGPILVLAGAIQLLAGVLKLGGWFRAISPAVVHGMLAGIGLLIVLSQFHMLFDATPLAGGIANLAAMPGRLLGLEGGVPAALFIGLLTIAVMLGWEKFRPAGMKLLPGALLGVMAATLVAMALGLDVVRVTVPESIASAVVLPGEGFLAQMFTPTIIVTALAIAFIASAETLLSAAAVDRMHNGVRTNYNRELGAQGVGNLLCGLAGALPMTGVIVRSSANVQAGATTRLSTILHGIWILAFVALLPFVLAEIPMAALAGVLVVTGAKLVSLKHVKHLFERHGFMPVLVWAATFTMVVATDLLTGVLVGIGLSLLELVPHIRRLGLKVEDRAAEAGEIALNGTATFVSLPKLSDTLDRAPATGGLKLDLSGLNHIDHTSAELLDEWVRRRRDAGHPVELAGARPGLLAVA